MKKRSEARLIRRKREREERKFLSYLNNLTEQEKMEITNVIVEKMKWREVYGE